MINLAARDILHSWGKFVFTGVGLGLLIGVTLTMAGVYRGMVDDAKVLLDASGAELWVVQKDTLGPYAESSSVPDDLWRSIRTLPGVAQAANITYLTMQVRQGERDVRAMVVGITAGGPGVPGWPPQLAAGRHITRGHYEAVADGAKARTANYSEIVDLLVLLRAEPNYQAEEKAVYAGAPMKKLMNKLKGELEALPANKWTLKTLDKTLQDFNDGNNAKYTQYGQSLRWMLTGMTTGVPLHNTLALLGRDESLRRLGEILG